MRVRTYKYFMLEKSVVLGAIYFSHEYPCNSSGDTDCGCNMGTPVEAEGYGVTIRPSKSQLYANLDLGARNPYFALLALSLRPITLYYIGYERPDLA